MCRYQSFSMGRIGLPLKQLPWQPELFLFGEGIVKGIKGFRVLFSDKISIL